jgi:hypothetical protein
MVRWIILSLVALLIGAGTTHADPIGLDDIKTWVGTGSNRAAFVLDWNTGGTAESVAWGYRWDGVATGEDMFRAIAGADVGVFGTVDFFQGLGYALYGAGYDRDRDGNFGVSPALTFVNGIAELQNAGQLDPSRVATDPEDDYREDWWTGFWSYWVRPDGSSPWGFSPVGMSSRVLTDGGWDGWSFAPGFDATEPSDPVPAGLIPSASTPEPTTLGIALGIGCVIAVVQRRVKV